MSLFDGGVSPDTCKLRVEILSKIDVSDRWNREAMVHAYALVELGCDEDGRLYELRRREIDNTAEGLRPIQETMLFSLVTQANAQLRARARCECARPEGSGD